MMFKSHRRLPEVLSAAFLIVFLPSTVSWAAPNTEAAFIPRRYEVLPASDLMFEGQPITPDQAHQKVIQSGYKFDLSLLEPDDSTDIWKNIGPREADPEKLAFLGNDELKYAPTQEVTYLNNVPSRGGTFRFVAKQSSAEGTHQFVFMLSKTAHNVLLRKALLRRLGYYVPATVHAARVRLRFTTSLDKELFLKELADQTFGDPKRWVVPPQEVISDPEEANKRLDLQDVVVIEEQNRRYNLAMGYVPSSLIANRRIFNSLIVPYSLVEVPESVNGFSYAAGGIVDDHVRFSYPASDQFSCGFEDARWAIRRVLRLTRKDFEAIVEEGHFPSPVAALLVEKLIGRRDSLLRLFMLPGASLPFDPNVSELPDLSRGKILKETWDGYASRFSFGDPTSPLSSGEIARYFGSTAIGEVLDNAVNFFNSKIPVTDIQGAYDRHQLDALAQAIVDAFKNGSNQVASTALGVWGTPFWDGGLTLSRHVVAGSYLGTNNLVQLVDSIGLTLDAGGAFVLEGAKLPLSASLTNQSKATVSRVYSHVKPVSKMRQALSYPFRNIMVPLLRRRNAHTLARLTDGSLSALPEADRIKRLDELLKIFKDGFSVGESLIITDLVGASTDFKLTTPITSAIPILFGQADVSGQSQIISRLHVFRAGENLFQIYKDVGTQVGYGISAGISAIVPVISLYRKANTGKISTHLYTLDITQDPEKNPAFMDNLQDLENALTRDSLERVAAKQKPYSFSQRFRQQEKGLGFFYRAYDTLTSRSDIIATLPTGESKSLIRRTYGKRRGSDYQKFLVDTVNNTLGIILGGTAAAGVNLSNTSTGDPGDTFMGNSISRVVDMDAEVLNATDDNNGLVTSADSRLKDPTVHINYRWKGWKIGHNKAVNLLRSLESRFKFPFFADTALQNVRNVGLYSLDVNIMTYVAGIDHAMSLPRDEINRIVDNYWKPYGFLQAHLFTRKRRAKVAAHFATIQYNYNLAVKLGNTEFAASEAQRFFADAEALLTLQGMTEMAGGPDNVYAFSKLSGFRTGAEDGDAAYFSDTLGRVGSDLPMGPVVAARDKIKAIEGEFLGYWLLWRLQ